MFGDCWYFVKGWAGVPGWPLLGIVRWLSPITLFNSEKKSKKARGSGKNSRHGDKGRAYDKAKEQIAGLETQMEGASVKEKNKIKKKIQRIREDAARKAKGEEHSRRAK